MMGSFAAMGLTGGKIGAGRKSASRKRKPMKKVTVASKSKLQNEKLKSLAGGIIIGYFIWGRN